MAERIGQNSDKFAMHVKGHKLAAHNCQSNPPRALCYATSHRGACHLNGNDAEQQNMRTIADSAGLCFFAMYGYGTDGKILGKILSAIIGQKVSAGMEKAGERIYNLEQLFNCREGFTRADDVVPDRYFEEPLTVGDKKGAVMSREKFKIMMDEHYTARGWNPDTTLPIKGKLEQLGLDGDEYRI